MTQRTVGIYHVLGSPQVYRAVQRAIRSSRLNPALFDYLRPHPGERLLDVGCGTGEISATLSGIDYVGFDISERYIRYARKKFGRYGTFLVRDISSIDGCDLGTFDIVMAYGVLHHVDDETAHNIYDAARRLLTPTGRMVTVDGCYDPSQSRLARFIVSRDRGTAIRTLDQYRALAEQSFMRVTEHLHHDLYRIPYTLAILEAAVPKHARPQDVAVATGTPTPPSAARSE